MARVFLTAMCAVAVVLGAMPSAKADIVLSTFEEPDLAVRLTAEAAYEGETGAPSQFRSGKVTFNNDGVAIFLGGTSWGGFGYSRRTAPVAGQELYNNSNDLISKPATGASGSLTWAVVGNGGVMTADAGYQFTAIDVTSTLYTWISMAQGDAFAGGPMTNGGGTGRFLGQDDFFTIRFTNTANSSSLDFNLADYRGNTDYVVDNWRSFDLSLLKASQLSISFLGTRETNFGDDQNPFYFMDTPAYAAFDNIAVTAVPEPGSCALVLAGLGLAAVVRYKRRLVSKSE